MNHLVSIVDRARRRAEICAGCPELRTRLGVEICGALARPRPARSCGCVLSVKRRLWWARCPQGRWEAEPPEENRNA